jgi:tetratricopeptide (TPR) repeat protein
VRSNFVSLILCIPVFFLSCWGGSTRYIRHEHLTAGMNQIKKGNEFYQKGCYRRSLENYFKAHEQFSAVDQPSGVAMSLNNIGNVYRIMGDKASALIYFDAAYHIYGYLQDNEGIVQVLSNKAAALLDNDQLVSAEACLETADRIATEHHLELAALYRNKAILHMKKKEYRQAEDILNALLKNIDPDNLTETAAAHAAMGHLLIETHQYSKGIEFLEKALEADRESGFYKGLADILAAIGSAYQKLGEFTPASYYYQRSIKIYALIGDRKKVDTIMERLNDTDQKTELDTTLTRHFVERWLAGEADGPCE